MHATRFLLLALVSLVATPRGLHQHSEPVEVEHAQLSVAKGLRKKVHKHKAKHKVAFKVDQNGKKIRTHHWHDPTSLARAADPIFHIGYKLIRNAKRELRNKTDTDHDGSGAADSFVIADHDAKLIVKGHSEELRRMQRHAGPDICLAKARALVMNSLDATRTCRSLLCTAAYTLAYTLGFKHDLPTPGCQMIENVREDIQEHERTHEKSEMSEESKKSEKSKKPDILFFCNAKFPKLLPRVLLKSGFGPVEGKPGFWRANSTTSFPLGRYHPGRKLPVKHAALPS